MYRFRKGNFFILTILLLLLVSCSSTSKQLNEVGVSKNDDLLAQFAFAGRIYSLEGNRTPDDKIKRQVGKIDEMVEDITKNGQATIITPGIKLKSGCEIYTIQDVDNEMMLAIKMENQYYTAIFMEELD